MLDCHEATRSLSERLDRPIGRTRSLALALHLLICNGCRRFGRQVEFLRRVGRALGEADRSSGGGR